MRYLELALPVLINYNSYMVRICFTCVVLFHSCYIAWFSMVWCALLSYSVIWLRMVDFIQLVPLWNVY